jgi:hypothetical protein
VQKGPHSIQLLRAHRDLHVCFTSKPVKLIEF